MFLELLLQGFCRVDGMKGTDSIDPWKRAPRGRLTALPPEPRRRTLRMDPHCSLLWERGRVMPSLWKCE